MNFVKSENSKGVYPPPLVKKIPINLERHIAVSPGKTGDPGNAGADLEYYDYDGDF